MRYNTDGQWSKTRKDCSAKNRLTKWDAYDMSNRCLKKSSQIVFKWKISLGDIFQSFLQLGDNDTKFDNLFNALKHKI